MASTIRFQVLYVLRFLSIERRHIIRLQRGQHSKSWRPFRGILRRSICYTTATAFAGIGFGEASKTWASKKSSRRRTVPGKIHFSGRLNGSVRQECLDHVIVLGENHLRRIIADYVAYCNGPRTHLSLEMDGAYHHVHKAARPHGV